MPFASNTAAVRPLHAAPEPALARVERALAQAIAALGATKPTKARKLLAEFSPAARYGAAHALLIARVLSGASANDLALRWLDAAAQAGAAVVDVATLRGQLLVALGRPAEALPAFEAAIAAGQRDPAAVAQFGHLLAAAGRLDDALVAFDVALQLQPGVPGVLRAAADVHRRKGEADMALALLDRAMASGVADPAVALDRANLLHQTDRFEAALVAYETALTLWPEDPQLLNNRAVVLHDLGRMVEALAGADRALMADPTAARTHMNRGNILFRLSRFADAEAAFDAALAREPRYPDAHCGRGLTRKMMGRFDEAAADFEAALTQDSASIYARANRGELKLLRGDFAGGWPDYEFRFFTERQKKPKLGIPLPEWTGQPLEGARLVVFADQGNGDTLQFARFLPCLKARGAHVTFICPPRLQRILAGVTNGLSVCASVGDETAFDFQVALSSLPGAFGSTPETLARLPSPYLAADPATIELWGARLDRSRFNIGLCWRGSQNWQCDPNRSLPLAAFAPLAALPRVSLVSLQMPDNAERTGSDLPLTVFDDLDAGPHAFADTAALIENLDLVITCDTSIAHLAGALGRPTWVLLQAVPEWRWMLERTDTPWYPTTRLFRQTRLCDWADVMEAVVGAVRTIQRI